VGEGIIALSQSIATVSSLRFLLDPDAKYQQITAREESLTSPLLGTIISAVIIIVCYPSFVFSWSCAKNYLVFHLHAVLRLDEPHTLRVLQRGSLGIHSFSLPPLPRPPDGRCSSIYPLAKRGWSSRPSPTFPCCQIRLTSTAVQSTNNSRPQKQHLPALVVSHCLNSSQMYEWCIYNV